MPENYEIFEAVVQEKRSEIESGKETRVPIKDLETFAKMSVEAVIAESEIPGGSKIRVVNDMGERRGALFIKINRVLDEID